MSNLAVIPVKTKLVLLLALVACSEPLVPDASISDDNQTPTIAQPGSLSLVKTDWTYLGEPLNWSNDASGALTFVFPSKQTVDYAYEWVKVPKVIKDSVSASVTISVVSGNPIFHFDSTQPATCTMPPFVVLFISSNWSSATKGQGDDDRWWAFVDKQTLAAGTYNLHAALDPSRWINVNGETGLRRPTAWNTATSNINGVGVTFGGGCYYGHGVFVSGGTAHFAVTHLAAA